MKGSSSRRPSCPSLPRYELFHLATWKAERHLPQDTVRRLLSRDSRDWREQESSEPARDSDDDEDESTSSEEVRATYKGMIH